MKPILALIILAQLVSVSTALAVPNLINYQGKLSNASGSALTGTFTMRFQLYPDLEGGPPVWSETRNVNVIKGMYDVLLGGVVPFQSGLFSTDPLYLQISVLNSSNEYEPLTPRQRLTSSPYALRASDADTVGGKTPVQLAGGEHNHHISEITGDIDAHTLGGLAPSAFAAAGHNHDGRYYRKTEVDNRLDLKADASHAHDARYHIKDDLYTRDQLYTRTEVNTQLSGKANSIHSHDDRYYTKSQVDALVNPLIAQIADLQAAVSQLNALLAGVSRVEDGKVLRFSGMNVQIVNGRGATNTINGLGNLIIGYDEVNTWTDLATCSNGYWKDQISCEGNGEIWSHTHKSGSHFLVTGYKNSYSRFGGIVSGQQNFATGTHATVTGGVYNTASGHNSSVTGGRHNTAGGTSSSVSGGYENTASVSYSSVSGGSRNIASGATSSVSGGNNNTASGVQSSVSGGRGNIASGRYSSVSGGYERSATGEYNWAAGGYSSSK
jgi:hypothetical protein